MIAKRRNIGITKTALAKRAVFVMPRQNEYEKNDKKCRTMKLMKEVNII